MKYVGKRAKTILIIVLIITLFFMTPFFQVTKSYLVMAVYSKIHENQSFLHQEGIKVHMPGGLSTLQKDFYPFVMTYDSSEAFSERIGENIEMVVLYNFGAMEWLKGASLLYNSSSAYYNTFYGMYALKYKDSESIYGYKEDKSLNTEQIMLVTDYDLKVLVLDSVGDKNPRVEYTIINQEPYEIKEINGRDFYILDATIKMDSIWHEPSYDYQAYIQYGRPPSAIGNETSFQLIDSYGRIYISFDEEKKISYFLYIIGTDLDTLHKTEKNFILKTIIK